MEKRGLFRAILVIGIIANLVVIGIFASEKKKANAVVSWQPVTAQNTGISFKFPSNWKVQEFERQADVETKYSTPGNTYISVICSLEGALVMDLLKFNPTSREPPLKTYHEMYMSSFEDRLVKYKDLGTKPTSVNGVEAYQTIFEYTTWNGMMARQMRSSIISTWNGSNHIAIRYAAPIKEYDASYPVFQTFLQAFHPRKPIVEETGLVIPGL